MRFRFLIVLSAGFLFAAHVSAQTSPWVTSFTASPSSLSNAYTSVLSWQIAGGTGSNLYFSCPVGVTIKDENGGQVSCTSAVNANNYASGSSAYTFYNFSGMTANVYVRLVPRDVYGVENSSGSASLVITVSPAAQLITSFSVSTVAPKSGDTVTFTWTGVYASGVNLQFECSDKLRYSIGGTSNTTLSCGVPAFSQDLPISGSQQVVVTNTGYSEVPARVTILPSQGSGFYNATRSMSVYLTVSGQTGTVSPTATRFSLSRASVYSGEVFDVYWGTAYAKGANIQFQCDPSKVTVSQIVGTTTVSLPCNAPAFLTPLGQSGTTTIAVLSKENFSSYTNMGVILLLQQNDDTYTAAGSRSETVRVSSAVAPISTPSTAPPSPAQTQSPGTVTAAVSNTTFTIPLERGSRGAQVTALQSFLAKNPAIYPEALVTGYFGTLTEAAVKRFQFKYGVASQGDPGYGYVGPKTRAKLNSLSSP